MTSSVFLFSLIQEKSKGELVGLTERTETDRKRARRDKKLRQREKQKHKEKKEKLMEKLNPGLGNKYAKERALKDLEKQSKLGKSGVTVLKVIFVFLCAYFRGRNCGGRGHISVHVFGMRHVLELWDERVDSNNYQIIRSVVKICIVGQNWASK